MFRMCQAYDKLVEQEQQPELFSENVEMSCRQQLDDISNTYSTRTLQRVFADFEGTSTVKSIIQTLKILGQAGKVRYCVRLGDLILLTEEGFCKYVETSGSKIRWAYIANGKFKSNEVERKFCDTIKKHIEDVVSKGIASAAQPLGANLEWRDFTPPELFRWGQCKILTFPTKKQTEAEECNCCMSWLCCAPCCCFPHFLSLYQNWRYGIRYGESRPLVP